MTDTQGVPLATLADFSRAGAIRLADLNVHTAEGFLALAAAPNTRARLLDYLDVDEAGLRELEGIAGAALPDEVRRRMSAPADTSGFGLGALPPDRPDPPDEPHRP
jgi:hypothetical protein